MTASPVGKWRTSAGQEAYESAYQEILKSMPAFEESYDIPTDYGTVRAYRWSNPDTEDKTPIVLFPGRTTGVPMWSQNIPDLIKERPVYALDAIGDSGMSVQTKKIATDADQAKWMDQTLEGLKIQKAHIVGHSIGGWLAMNYATTYPDRVQSLSLFEPIRTFTDMHLSIYISSIPAALPFLPQSWGDNFLKEVSGEPQLDPNDPTTRMISAATNDFALTLPFPGMITQEALQSLPMPVYVAMGTKSSMHDSKKALEVARQNIHTLDAQEWPEGTHSLPMENPSQINASLLKFIDKSEMK